MGPCFEKMDHGAPYSQLLSITFATPACAFAYATIVSTNFRWYIVHMNIKLSLIDLMMDASLALSFPANTCTTLLMTHTLWSVQ
ncbi:hypothetical protein H2248_005585 [Termitomyces sp. 'cryptogamus']|nr:hypothetical protein H2248_005585 [Termitomyces sp. 'cryptogamus']